MTYELIIQHNGTVMFPAVVEDVTIEWERQGQPGKLSFEVVKTDGLSFQEGDPCRFSVDGSPIFYGFVFEKSRKGSNPKVIKVTAYDQLYYLKNKDTYVYTDKTATEVIQMVADDFQLNLGSLEGTGHKIASRVEDNQTLFDIIQLPHGGTGQAHFQGERAPYGLENEGWYICRLTSMSWSRRSSRPPWRPCGRRLLWPCAMAP